MTHPEEKLLLFAATTFSVAIDLLDTLKANEAGCVGMAANMIGVKKRIIGSCPGRATAIQQRIMGL